MAHSCRMGVWCLWGVEVESEEESFTDMRLRRDLGFANLDKFQKLQKGLHKCNKMHLINGPLG
jgi:hypothetical protein